MQSSPPIQSPPPMQNRVQRITRRQRQVLDVVRDHIDYVGYPPTRAEIARKLGFRSANSAEEHLKALARKGVIELIVGASRGIRLLDDIGIPVIGRVAAGRPMLAREHIEDFCDMPATFFKPAADYFLRIRGNSMIGAGIHDQDLLAVHRTERARDGDIVVARVDGQVTVKRLRRGTDKTRLSLVPENADYQPVEVNLRRRKFVIEGRSVGVLRRGC